MAAEISASVSDFNGFSTYRETARLVDANSRMIMKSIFAALLGVAVSFLPHPALADSPDYRAHDAAAPQQLDHSNFSALLQRLVLDVGVSDREKPEDRTPAVGSRIMQGSTSNFRFEGNRVMFHLFTEQTRASFAVYRAALEETVDQIGFVNFNRDEQLAILLNLHNALMLEAIAEQYPVSDLQDAKFRDDRRANLDGEPVSLNDIRSIIYSNWSDPIVIYGVWDGVIGGPSLLTTAYDARNVRTLLAAGAREFTTSRRGFERFGKKLSVSRLYDDTRKFFPDFENDVVAHLRSHAEPHALEELSGEVTSVSPRAYDWAVADIFSGDQSPPDLPNAQEGDIIDSLGLRDTRQFLGVARLNGSARALIGKVYEYRRRTGRVTIEDVDTPDPDAVSADRSNLKPIGDPPAEETPAELPQPQE